MEHNEDILNRTLDSLDKLEWADPSPDFLDRVMARIPSGEMGRASRKFIWQMAAAVAFFVAINGWVWTATPEASPEGSQDQAYDFAQTYGIAEQI
jgi:hypothetical protein